MQNEDHALRECPFCGGSAERIDIDSGENAGGSAIVCTRCLASGNIEFGRKENFISNWNTRAALSATPKQGVFDTINRIERYAYENWPADMHDFFADQIELLADALDGPTPAPIDNEALVEDIVGTLEYCRDQFRSYVEQHFAKGTSEGRDKADVNYHYEAVCDRTLANIRAVLALPSIASSLQKTQTTAALAEEAIGSNTASLAFAAKKSSASLPGMIERGISHDH